MDAAGDVGGHRLALNRRVVDGIWLGAVWAIQFLADPRTSFYASGCRLHTSWRQCYLATGFRNVQLGLPGFRASW